MRGPMVPNPGDTLMWDDGSTWTYIYYFSAGNGWGVEFQPLYYPCRVTSLIIWFNDGWPIPGGDDLILVITDDDGPDGSPGTVIYADTLNDVAQLGAWNEFAVGDTGIVIEDGIFYGVYLQAADGPDCPSVAFDHGYETNHCWAYYNDVWSPNSTWGDFLLRAVTERAGGDAHDVGVKVILQPGIDYDPSSTIIPAATVKNYGTYTETFDVNCLIQHEGATVYEQIAEVTSLPPDNSTEVQFPQWSPESGNVYNVEVSTMLGSDVTPSNDMRSRITKNYTQTRRAVLIEGGTGTWCYYCQFAAQGLDSLRKVAGDSVAIIEYHQGDAFTTTGSLARLDYYNVSAYPTVVFDGTEQTSHSGEYSYDGYRQLTDNHFGLNVPVDMTLNGNYDSGTRNGFVQVGIDAVNGIASNDLRLYAVLTENHIAYDWFDEDSLQFVMREIFPDTTGVSVNMNKGDSRLEIINFQVDSEYVDTNCDIAVFLQSQGSKTVLGALTSPLYDLTPISITGDDTKVRLPQSVQLRQNYPNPFNPQTRIDYAVPEGKSREVDLAIYTMRGVHVKTLVSGIKAPGRYSVTWNGKDEGGRDVGSGIYFYRLRVGDIVKNAKMLLVK